MPLHWKRRVLTTRLPGKSKTPLFKVAWWLPVHQRPRPSLVAPTLSFTAFVIRHLGQVWMQSKMLNRAGPLMVF